MHIVLNEKNNVNNINILNNVKPFINFTLCTFSCARLIPTCHIICSIKEHQFSKCTRVLKDKYFLKLCNRTELKELTKILYPEKF